MTSASLRKLRVFLWGLVAASGLASAWFAFNPSERPLPQAREVGALATAQQLGQGDYALLDHEGKPFTAESLKGRPSLVFFGFTHCPDVCPTTLGDIAGWREALGEESQDLRTYFVTVDPERDTPEILRDYLGWSPETTGVTGAPEELAKAQAAFGIYASKVPLEGQDYTMDHSAYVLFFDREGRFAQLFAYQEEEAQVLAKLRAALRS